MKNQIIHGDCLEVLKTLPDNSVDLVVTDPPYGYSFMGKDWDKAVPSVEVWKECLRVLKPGAFALIMSAPRSDVQCEMISRIRDAGFRVDFTPIYWTYASGFPKAMNIGKMVDKRLGAERDIPKSDYGVSPWSQGKCHGCGKTRGSQSGNCQCDKTGKPLTDQAKALDGSYGGFQPKPAVEVIIVAMKPLSEKTFVDQALKNGKGVTWLDECRVPTNPDVDDKRLGGAGSWDTSKAAEEVYEGGYAGERISSDTRGRFPANLLVSDDVLNDGRVQKSFKGATRKTAAPGGVVGWNAEEVGAVVPGFGDSGSYSRYFSLDAWAKTLPFLIVPKASKREKNEGLDAFPVTNANRENAALTSAENRSPQTKNAHPTVKPLTLMSYLITLGSREGDTILDPFLGSGTTAVAAKQLNRNYIGIEREKEYVDIAEARIRAVPESLFNGLK